MNVPQFNDIAIQPFDYVLHLADSSLIMGHRLSEWTGHGPMLEQDMAITNIALDLIGQSRNFYQYAASIANSI
ncbi:MAG TPA: Phenylacetic acid catabolic protein, partial [Hanamia sp.]|nr:Phenylacetic acid catabolic protein [Hanamia sp.]